MSMPSDTVPAAGLDHSSACPDCGHDSVGERSLFSRKRRCKVEVECLDGFSATEPCDCPNPIHT